LWELWSSSVLHFIDAICPWKPRARIWSRYNCVASSGCTTIRFTAVFTAGGVCNSITGLAASPDPVNFLASANDYFPEVAFDTNHPSLSSASADLFTFGGSGLLTIGTLGIAGLAASEGDEEDDEYSDVDVVDANNNDATTEEHDDTDGALTPTFTYAPPPPEATGVVEKVAVALEAIAEKDDDTTTEDDLMVVSAELEKVLGGRNSGAAGDLVASARASFATGGVDCPLQGFLFGSPVSDAESWQGRRDSAGGGRRTSLGELFLRTRFADEKVALVAVEEGEDGKADGEEGRAGKGGGGGKVMNRKLKDDEKYAGGASESKSKFRKVCVSLLTFLSPFYRSKSLVIRRSRTAILIHWITQNLALTGCLFISAIY
jgi:hypothetical protein